MSVRSISTGPSCSIEPPASAPPAERGPDAIRFEQALERESERVSDRDDASDDDVAPAAERARSDAATHDAEASVERDDEPLAADDASAESDADGELAALEQLLQVVAGTPPPQAPTLAPDGGDSTVAVGGAVAAIAVNASQATLLAGAGAPAGNGAKSGVAANGPVSGAPAGAAEGETAAIDAPADPTGEGATNDSAFLGGGAARSKHDASALDTTALDASALPDTATLDPELAERFARELADARPIAALSVLAAPTATTETSAQASVARATATLAQLPALLDDAVVRLQRHDGRWEAEIRLDPPELGVVSVRLELDGGHLRVVARCDDRSVEQQLGQLFKEWDETLRKQGGEASFDLDRRAKEEERDARLARGERSLPPARAERSGVGVGPGAGLRIDLLA